MPSVHCMKKIINFTPTGTQPTRENSFAPLEVNEIIEEVHQAYEKGITIAHIHARDPKHYSNTYKKEFYGPIIEGVRKYCSDLLICASLTGRNFPELTQRTEVLECLPDMGSLTMSSLNFPSGASVNQPEMILNLIGKMEEWGVKPEIECFDSGMVNYTKYLISKNILKPPYYMNVILGNIYNGQSDLSNVANIKTSLPDNVICCLGGVGPQQLRSNVLGLLDFDGVRVGLEDNLYFHEKNKATNMELLTRIRGIMEYMGCSVMTPTELREMGYGNKIIDSRKG